MKPKGESVHGLLVLLLVLLNAIILETALLKNYQWYKVLWITTPLLLLCLFDKWHYRAPFKRKQL